MRNRKYGNFLEHLLDATNTKCSQRHRLRRTLHLAVKEFSEEAIIDNLVPNYLPTVLVATHTDCKGSLDSKLDADLSIEEIGTALQY